MPLRPIATLVLREIATTHGRSFGGYAWMILEPVGTVCILSVVFSLFFAKPPLGGSFPLFYASGYLVFTMFSDVAQKTALSLRYSRPLLAYPVVNWLDAVMARFTLAFLTHLLVCAIVISGITVVEDLTPRFDVALLVSALAAAAFLGLCVGAINIVLFDFFPVWERLWTILTRPLFLISGVLFLPDQLPDPYRDWLAFNPVVHVIALMREGIYVQYSVSQAGLMFVMMVSMMLLVIALILLGRHARGLILGG